MYRQCSKEQVLGLPSSNRHELSFRENVEDRQILLHEDWSLHAAKNNLPQNAVRVKNATESWVEFESRKKLQDAFFELHEKSVVNENLRNEAAREALQAKSNCVIDKLLAYDRTQLSKRTAPQHPLFVDFRKLQQQLFEMQIIALEEVEKIIREKICECENYFLYLIEASCHADSEMRQIRANERIKEEQAMQRQRELMERQKVEEERQNEMERVAREKQKAEAEKQRAETERRLERKRREEERRAKARLEREQRASHDGVTEN